MHLFMGIMAYLCGSLWFVFLATGTWIARDRFNSGLSPLPFASFVHRWFGIDGFQHISLLEQSELSASDEALAKRCLMRGTARLSKSELAELLYTAPAMLLMHRAVWLRPSSGIHATWTQAVESYRHRLDQSMAVGTG